LPPPDKEKLLTGATPTAAVERVPQIKPEDVEEVFFGNVLSAK
jgi:acetyl-CoA C-acetyltransferase